MAYRLLISIAYECKEGVGIRLPICVSCHVANSTTLFIKLTSERRVLIPGRLGKTRGNLGIG